MNPWQTLESLLAQLSDAQIALADTVRTLVYKSDASLFEKLDFEDDLTFLEPGLFAYFTAPDRPLATLEQLLFSYLPEQARSDRLRVYADSNGAIHLPRVGSVTHQVRGAFCEVGWNRSTSAFCAADGRSPLPLSVADFLDDGRIEVDRTIDPLVTRFVAEDWSRADCGVYPVDYPTRVSALGRALAIMRGATPALFES
jgi:hypothetical protein